MTCALCGDQLRPGHLHGLFGIFAVRFRLGPSIIISIGIHSNISTSTRKKYAFQINYPTTFQLFQNNMGLVCLFLL